MSSQVAEQLVANFARIVQMDGGRIEILAIEPERITLGYAQGQAEACESGACMLPHVELKVMMDEWLSRRAPGVKLIVRPIGAEGSESEDSK